VGLPPMWNTSAQRLNRNRYDVCLWLSACVMGDGRTSSEQCAVPKNRDWSWKDS
jgi:hypothetical protein